MGLRKLFRFRPVAAAVSVCLALLAWAPTPALASGGGSDPPFIYSTLSIDAGGPLIQGQAFQVFATGSNESPPDGLNTGEVPYELDLYLLPAKLSICPTSEQAMVNLYKKYPKQIQYVFNQPVPEASVGPGLYGGFTTPVFSVRAGNFSGRLSICGYSTYIGLDAAWYAFGPVPIAKRIPKSGFRSHRVTLGKSKGCWPVANTARLRDQGLIGVSRPARPMVFTYPRAGKYDFTMEDVPAAVNAVWIGRSHKVIGHWHGTANSTKVFKPPAAVLGAVLYPATWRVPANGTRLHVGAGCKSKAGL